MNKKHDVFHDVPPPKCINTIAVAILFPSIAKNNLKLLQQLHLMGFYCNYCIMQHAFAYMHVKNL